jgi:hypothetical protein
MRPEKTWKLTEVYGTSRDVPQTYVIRRSIDDRFLNDITRDRHIIIHGGSKQGKTCLRKYHLREDDHVVIQCTREATKATLYEMVLKRAGIPCEVSERITQSGTRKLYAKVAVEAKVPLLMKGGGEAGLEGSKSKETTRETKDFEIDPEDPNEVARVLGAAGWSKFIVIEDFHYLDEDVQRAIAVDLKVFHEISPLIFIVIGVWLEANRLTLYNGDLIGRVTTLNADQWLPGELKAVIDSGEPLLYIRFPDEVKAAIVSGSQGNVGLLQEVCSRLCEGYDIWQTGDALRTVGKTSDVDDILRALSDEQASRYRNFLYRFAQGLGETQHEMYKWLLWAVIKASPSELKSGLRANVLLSRIAKVHPSGNTLQQNNVVQALERVQKVHFRHKLQPVVLDYSNDELLVVDPYFLVFLQSHSKEDLLAHAGFGTGQQEAGGDA